MQILAFKTASDYSVAPIPTGTPTRSGYTSTHPNSGDISQISFDYIYNISSVNHPALIPNLAITSSTSETGAALSSAIGTTIPGVATIASTSNHWINYAPFTTTSTVGDTLVITPVAGTRQVVLSFQGILTAGSGGIAGSGLTANQFRQGGIVSVTATGLSASVDTYNTEATLTISISGTPSAITITNTGRINLSATPVSPVQAGIGLSMAAASAASFIQGTQLTGAQITLTALSATTYSIQQTISGATTTVVASATVSSTPNAGTYVPGVSLLVNGALTTGDTATFMCDPVQCTLSQISFGVGTSTTGSYYTTPVLDSGNSNTQWFLAEWTENIPFASVSVAVTDTNPFSGFPVTWTTTVLTPTEYQTSLLTIGTVGLTASPRGQYATFTFNFSTTSIVTPFLRDLFIYYWVPESDTTIWGKLGIADSYIPGVNALTYIGTLETFLAYTRYSALEYVSGMAISTAVDSYLISYGNDFEYPIYTSEPLEAYRTRLLAAISTRQDAGSLGFVQQQLQDFTGVAVTLTNLWNTNSLTPYQWQATIGPSVGAYYPNLPGLPKTIAQQLITQFITTILNPLGNIITPGLTSSNIIFV